MYPCTWKWWVAVCREENANPLMDAYHEAYEFRILSKLYGTSLTIRDLCHLPIQKATLLLQASHAMACMLVANQFGTPDCPSSEKNLTDKCKYCCLVRYLDGNDS